VNDAPPPPRVLIADDQADVLQALRLLLKSEGFQIDVASSPAAILSAVEAKDFDAVLLDLNYTRDTTSGREGLDLLNEIRRLDNTLPVIVMTAWASVETAVNAMRIGARDYVQKPWDNARLLATLRTQVELGQALRREQRLEEESRRLRRQGLPELIAESKVMAPVLEIMERVAPSEANVLITGEHGTGKDVVARWLHAASDRASKPLVTMNAGGVAESLFESELFGHVKGAYTDAKTDRIGCFELADGGTLFLDEIANVPVKQQAKLLRVLESGELQRVGSSKTRKVDVRVLSATNANITGLVAEGGFREDLLYRLNTVEIHLPPLRDRLEDIPLLATHFLRRHAEKYGRPTLRFEPDAMRALRGHSWPGNVRELEHVVERSILMARGDSVRADDLGLRNTTDGGAQLEQMTLDDAESFLIQKALDRHDGNVSHAAAALGLSRSALYRRIQRYDLLNSGSSDG
jgi:DNA-binding NtrC family response regulator